MPTIHSLQPHSWIDAYGKELYRFAMQRLRNSEDAEDVVQETFLTAWKTRESYRGDVSERNWMYLILRSRIIDLIRKRRDSVPLLNEEAEEEIPFFDAQGEWIPSHAPRPWSSSPSDAIESTQFNELLNNCLDKLPHTQRSVFVLTYLDDEGPEKVRQELDITASNMWVLLHRARLKLRRCLDVHL
jgi:RNA polymerase sigma-70 factor (TIGR02943 family)